MTPNTTTEIPAQRYPITLVTAYFELDNSYRKRSVRDYHTWAANLLPFVRWPMVIFCDAQSLDTLKRLRGDKPAVFCVTRLQEFSTYPYRDIVRAQYAGRREAGLNPDLSLVINEKVNFVRRAIDADTFGSEMFFWCDIGRFRKGDIVLFNLSERIEWPNLRACRAAFKGRVGLFGHPLAPPSTGAPWPQGGFWGGPTEPLRRFCDAFDRCLAERVRRGDGIINEESTLRVTSEIKSINAHIFTGEIRWLRRLKFPPPPPPDFVWAYTILSAPDFFRQLSVKNLLCKIGRRLYGRK